MSIGAAISGAANMVEGRAQRKWARTNMKNQIQWRYADMKAAGINPILAAGSSGGGLPSGAMGTMPDIGDPIGDATSAYASYKKGKLDKQKTRESKMNEMKLSSAITLDHANAASARESAGLTAMQTKLAHAGLGRARIMATADQALLQPMLHRALQMLNDWTGTGKKAKDPLGSWSSAAPQSRKD